jgi:hypothetical protein
MLPAFAAIALEATAHGALGGVERFVDTVGEVVGAATANGRQVDVVAHRLVVGHEIAVSPTHFGAHRVVCRPTGTKIGLRD